MKRTLIAIAVIFFLPLAAQAWWDSNWTSRKQLTVDASATGADIKENLTDVPVLLRLHAGNFGFFSELAENGKDLRFMADDKTALKYGIEKVDPLAELGLVWIKLPSVRGGINSDSISMYYGNANVTDASDTAGIYDVNQALVFHFREGETLPQDATAYKTHAAESKAVIDAAGFIGAAAWFNGQSAIKVNPSPNLTVNPDSGWTFSVWLKPEQAHHAVLFEASETTTRLAITLQDTAITASYRDDKGEQLTGATPINVKQWQYLALTAEKNKLTLYVNGQVVGNVPIELASFNPAIVLGQDFQGLLDEVQIAKQARSADWLKFQFRSQSPDFNVMSFGQDESGGDSEGPNYFAIILQSVTFDGWVVIGLCGVMLVISLLVMISKGLVLRRAHKDNTAFLKAYRSVDAEHLAKLDQDESDEEQEIAESEMLSLFVGKHDHFQGSPIYHVYHAGINELKVNFGSGDTPDTLTPEALNLVRTRLDAAVVRENQRLNKHMVLLTIAISGGPFLGLLGTVMGVMITFAVIAATGDVNINSIAPGISGALAATVAGLAVAIPALFAYNYLLTQIKELTADMQVFTDEFLAMISKKAAAKQKVSTDLTLVINDEIVNLIAERVAAKFPAGA